MHTVEHRLNISNAYVFRLYFFFKLRSQFIPTVLKINPLVYTFRGYALNFIYAFFPPELIVKVFFLPFFHIYLFIYLFFLLENTRSEKDNIAPFPQKCSVILF